MEITREDCFSILCKDKAGALARVTAVLMENQVAMDGLWGFGVGQGNARIMAVPRHVEEFKAVADGQDWVLNDGFCFRVDGQDRQGVLVDILNKIAEQGVNLHAVDAMSLDGHFGCYLWAEEDDLEVISQVLGLSSPKF